MRELVERVWVEFFSALCNKKTIIQTKCMKSPACTVMERILRAFLCSEANNHNFACHRVQVGTSGKEGIGNLLGKKIVIRFSWKKTYSFTNIEIK